MASQPIDYGSIIGGAARQIDTYDQVQRALLGQQQLQQNANILAQQQNLMRAQATQDNAEQVLRGVQASLAANPQADDASFEGMIAPLGQVAPDKLMALRAGRARERDIASYFSDPTEKGVAQLMVKYPDLKDQLGKGWDVLNQAERRDYLRQASDVYGYLRAGAPDKAVQYISDLIYAGRVAKGEVSHLQQVSDIIKQDPKAGLGFVQLILAGENPDRFSANLKDLGDNERAEDLHPAKQRKAEADASIAESNSAWRGIQNAAQAGLAQARAANLFSLVNRRAKLLNKPVEQVTVKDMQNSLGKAAARSPKSSVRDAHDFFHQTGRHDPTAPTATDPRTGRKVRFNASTAKWEPM